MINQPIARYLADALQPLTDGIISRLSGLVKVLETDAFTPGKVSRFPIPVEATADSCSSSGKTFPDLVPDQSERLIIYFEDFGATTNGAKWISRIRLVGWGNAELFENVDPGLVVTLLMATIIRHLKRLSTPADSPIGNLKCEVLGSPEAAANLFSRYTYSETRSQYLLAPYFAFGLDLQLSFTLSDDCLNDLIGLPASQC